MKTAKSVKGFTLIEVLIATSLLAVMMVLLFNTLITSARSWNKGEEKIATVSQRAAVQNFFYRQLAAAQPLMNDFAENREERFSFTGKETSLQFVAAMPKSAERLGLQLFSLQFQREKISVSIKPFYPVTDEEKWKMDDVILLAGVKELKIRYFGAEKRGLDPEWKQEWKHEKLPELVGIRIIAEDGKFWPEMIVRLHNSGAKAPANQHLLEV